MHTLPAAAASCTIASRRPEGMPPTATVSTMRCLAAAAAETRGAAFDPAARCALGFLPAVLPRRAGPASGATTVDAAVTWTFDAPGVPCSSALRLRSANGALAAAKSTCKQKGCRFARNIL